MKVKAKHNIILDGVLHVGGEVFDVESTDGLADYVEEVGYVSDIFPQEEEQPVKKTRSRKKAE